MVLTILHFQDAFYKITKFEGVPALWSGLCPTLVLAVPCTVIYFVCYEQLRFNMKKMYNERTKTSKYLFPGKVVTKKFCIYT